MFKKTPSYPERKPQTQTQDQTKQKQQTPQTNAPLPEKNKPNFLKCPKTQHQNKLSAEATKIMILF